MGLLIFLVLLALALFAIPDPAEILPPLPVIDTLQSAVTAQPRVTAYFLAALFVLLPVSCWLAAWRSNANLRRQLSAEILLNPSTHRDTAPIPPAMSNTPAENRSA